MPRTSALNVDVARSPKPEGAEDLNGLIFGKLKVDEFHSARRSPSGGRSYAWVCTCSCTGKRIVAFSYNLKRGNTTSCGCAHKQSVTKHGLVGTVAYARWLGMMKRCYDTNSKDFKYWGGRGIKVCERWHEPANFVSDMGQPATPELTIDRIDNDGHYESFNCRWATQTVQQNNRSNNVQKN